MKNLKMYEDFKPKIKQQLDYDEMMEYLEKKYNFESRNFSGIPSQKKEDHFKTYQRIMNDPMPFGGMYPDSPGNKYRIPKNGKMIYCSKKEYDEAFKQIHDHYKRYKKWCETNPDIPYMDYWHYLCDVCEPHNGTFIHIPRKVGKIGMTDEETIEMYKKLKNQYKNDKKMQNNLDILISREEESIKNPKNNPWKDWQQQITDLIFKEFKEYVDGDSLEVWVEW